MSDNNILFEDRDQYLYARISGYEITSTLEIEYLEEIIEKCRQLSFDRLMVENELPTMLSVEEVYEVATEFARMPVKGLKIAFVDRSPEHGSQNAFMELIEHNRGVKAQFFSGQGKAELWMLRD